MLISSRVGKENGSRPDNLPSSFSDLSGDIKLIFISLLPQTLLIRIFSLQFCL